MNKAGALFHRYKDHILIFIISLLPLVWYGFDSNMLITSNDVGSSMNPVDLFKSRLFAWHSGIDFGVSQTDASGSIMYYGIEAFATFLTGSVFTGQKIVVILWFFAVMLSIYVCFKKIPVFADKPYMALLSSVLFQFNHFQQHGWRVFWRTRFSTYILLPIMLVLLIDYLEGRRKLFKTAIIVGLSVFLLNGGGSPPVFGTIILLVIATIIYFLFTNLNDKFFPYLKRSILFLLVSGIVSSVMSAFWFIPYLYNSLGAYTRTMQNIGGVAATITWTDVVSVNASVLNLLRFVGLPFWDTNLYFPNLFLNHPILIIFSFIWPILVFCSLFFVKKSEEKKYVILFLLLTITGLIFTAGTHKPFRDFYLFFLNNIPGWVMFRSPLYKFGNLLWFAYSVLIAFSLSSIIEKIKIKLVSKKNSLQKFAFLLPTSAILIIFLWDYPFFTSKFFGWNPPLTIMEKVPSYVFDFGKWMDQQEEFSSRTLLLPEMDMNFPAEVYRWGYWSFGSQLIPLLTMRNTVSNDMLAYDLENTLTASVIARTYRLLKYNDPTWLTLAQELNIRYLLLRKDYFYDLNWMPTTSPFQYERILAQYSNVEKIKTFGEWDLYRINTDNPANKIYINTKPIVYLEKSNDILELFPLIRQVYKESIKNIFFVSAEDLQNDFTEEDTVVVPGPIDIFLPVEKDGLALTKPKYLPGSPFYFLVEDRERKILEKTGNDSDLINMYIDLSLDRISELDELLRSNTDFRNIEYTTRRYISILDNIKNGLNSLLNNKNVDNRTVVRTKGYLMEEKKLLNKFSEQQKLSRWKDIIDETNKHLDNIIQSIPVSPEQEAVLSGITKPFNDPDIVFLTSGYNWKIPQEGIYEIYLNNNGIFRNYDKLTISIGSKTVEGKIDRRPTLVNWQKIGETELKEGTYGLHIIADGNNLASFRKKDLVFLKRSVRTESAGTTKLVYNRINPTKYSTTVFADTPVYLILDEKFDRGWKIYLKEKSPNMIKENQIRKTQLKHLKDLLDQNLLNTLFLKPLPEKIHMKVNGYANVWYIDIPSNLLGKELEVIIEYWPQRLFYLSFVINILAVGFSIIYLIITRNPQH